MCVVRKAIRNGRTAQAVGSGRGRLPGCPRVLAACSRSRLYVGCRWISRAKRYFTDGGPQADCATGVGAAAQAQIESRTETRLGRVPPPLGWERQIRRIKRQKGPDRSSPFLIPARKNNY